MLRRSASSSGSRLATATAVLALFGLASIATPAIADTFTPLNDPPTVLSTGLFQGGTATSSITPAHPRSTTVYTVSADVGSQGGLSNLDTVTMCLINGDNISYGVSGVADCSGAGTNPKNLFKMVWTQATDSFAVTGNNFYQNVSSVSNYGDGTALSATMEFKFKVSEAMLQGGSWIVRVEAVDDQGQVSTTGEAGPITVNYFGAVTTQRVSQDFGSLLGNNVQTIDGIKTGEFIANGVSYLTLAATDFTYSTNTVAIQGNGGLAPAAGEVAFDCEAGATHTSSGYRIGTTATSFDWNLFSGGTGESANTTHQHSCFLLFGGGASVANVQYTNTVTVGIGWGI